MPCVQEVTQDFHVSQAALDTDGTDRSFTKVWIMKNNSEILVASLNCFVPNVRLDLGFSVGEKITFYTRDTIKNVYLSGFYIPLEEEETGITTKRLLMHLEHT